MSPAEVATKPLALCGRVSFSILLWLVTGLSLRCYPSFESTSGLCVHFHALRPRETASHELVHFQNRCKAVQVWMCRDHNNSPGPHTSFLVASPLPVGVRRYSQRTLGDATTAVRGQSPHSGREAEQIFGLSRHTGLVREEPFSNCASFYGVALLD